MTTSFVGGGSLLKLVDNCGIHHGFLPAGKLLNCTSAVGRNAIYLRHGVGEIFFAARLLQDATLAEFQALSNATKQQKP